MTVRGGLGGSLTRAARVINSEPENIIMAAMSPLSSGSVWSLTFTSVIVLFVSEMRANERYDILSVDVRGIANNMINICIQL